MMKDKVNYLITEGIDVNAGLEYLGTLDIYSEIIGDFKNGFVSQMNEIKKCFEVKDIDNYAILVHALKSNCKTLGINKLAELSYNHELKAKEKDWEYINSHITELFTEANRILVVLNNI